jgi:hypothetical protein
MTLGTMTDDAFWGAVLTGGAGELGNKPRECPSSEDPGGGVSADPAEKPVV